MNFNFFNPFAFNKSYSQNMNNLMYIHLAGENEWRN